MPLCPRAHVTVTTAFLAGFEFDIWSSPAGEDDLIAKQSWPPAYSLPASKEFLLGLWCLPILPLEELAKLYPSLTSHCH